MFKYYIKSIKEIDDKFVNDNLYLLPKYRIEKINKLVKKEDKYLSFYAGYLLYILLKENGFNDIDKEIYFNENNKPLLPSKYNLYFSISHSKDMVFVAISDKKIGIDIEFIDEKINLNIKKYFSKEDIETLENSKNYLNTFFDIWTLKESYLKYLGEGLNKSLSSFYIPLNVNEYFLEGNKIIIKRIDCLDKQYSLSVVMEA